MVDGGLLWKYEHNPFGLVAFRQSAICRIERLFEQRDLSEYYACAASRPWPSITRNAGRYIHLNFIKTARCGAACHPALLIIPASIADEAGVAAATPKYRD
jgi:hypothetical protein